MEEFDVDLAFLAREIKREFCRQKAIRLKKAAYKPDARNDKAETWTNAAQMCRDLGASPEDFVTAAFMYCEMSTGPFPNNVGSKAMKRWYELYLHSRQAELDFQMAAATPSEYEIKNRVNSLRTILIHRFGTDDIENEDVITYIASPLFGLDPLACILWAGADERVLVRFRDEVNDMLQARPDILAAIKKLGFPLAIFNSK